MNREDIFNSELIGENGIPDLQTEIDKIQNGEEGFGAGGFGGNQDDTDIFGFGSQKKQDSEVEEED